MVLCLLMCYSHGTPCLAPGIATTVRHMNEEKLPLRIFRESGFAARFSGPYAVYHTPFQPPILATTPLQKHLVSPVAAKTSTISMLSCFLSEEERLYGF